MGFGFGHKNGIPQQKPVAHTLGLFSVDCWATLNYCSLLDLQNVPLLGALWSPLGGSWGLLKGSWGVLAVMLSYVAIQAWSDSGLQELPGAQADRTLCCC